MVDIITGTSYTLEQYESLLYQYKKRFFYKTFKRLFDIIISIFLLIPLFPVILIIALFIFIDDGNPVIFRQERTGQFMRPFIIYKFRTMKKNTSTKDGITQKNDERITKIGKKIRAFRLDEIPQLVNVLKGDMSFVGPRPDMLYLYDRENYLHQCVLMVKPGVTSPASIEFRNEEQILSTSNDSKKTYQEVIFPQKTIMNVAYVNDMSFVYDCKIMFDTIIAVIRR